MSSPKIDSIIDRKGDSIVNPNHSGVMSKNRIGSLIEKYILLSKNELVRAAIKDKLSEEWLFDQIVNTDSAQYFIYQIGHDVSDEGGMNLRFVTDQWM